VSFGKSHQKIYFLGVLTVSASSSIIEEVQNMSQTGLATLAFFYFDFRDASKQDARSLLCSLLIQLCHESDKLSDMISASRQDHGNGTRQPSEDVLMECLKEMLKLPGQGELYIVVDALDECPDFSGYPTAREQVLTILQELVELRLSHVHFCFTSRPEVDIRDALEGLAVHNVSLHEQVGQNQDIFDYIESVVSSDPKMRRWREEDKLLVINTLMMRARGMYAMFAVLTIVSIAYTLCRFRWVYCQIETLRRCFPTSLRRVLDELPETLDGTYEQSLRRIDKQKQDFACRLFQCLVVSKRPLLVEELAEFFAIQPDVDTIPTFDARWRPENPEEFILSACSTLVAIVNEYNDGRKIVQFSHFSVREYLSSHRIATSKHVSHFHVLPLPAHALVARACLSVLLQLDDSIVRDEIQDFPLASYAAQYWVDHAQFEDVSSGIQHGMLALFDKDKPHLAAWLRLYNLDNSYPYFMTPRARPVAQLYPVPLYYAALCGFRDVADHLINAHPQHVNARGGERVTPLHAAADKGHLSTATLLLQRGADIGSRDLANRTPLHMASYRGYVEVVSLLIDCGANSNAESDDRETPLYLASKAGTQDVVKLLLEHSVDSNYPDVHGSTPLYVASLQGHNHVVRLLLDHGADVNHPNNYGKTPMHTAWDAGYDNIVRLLLNHGADANRPDSRGRTLLHLALKKGHDDIAQLLLDNGADANHPDRGDLAPLHLTAHDEVGRLLFDHEAYANHLDRGGKTPLFLASERGQYEVVRSLFDHGADANRSDMGGLTPLHLATLLGRDNVVRLLLDRGADANRSDRFGGTPLHLASMLGYDSIVRLLLKHGADSNHLDTVRHGRTPLHLASKQGHIDIVQSLLDHGADAKYPDCDGLTPLHFASESGYDNIVRLLLDHGADANIPDGHGRTPLHRVSFLGHHDVARLLLDHGADANHPNSHDLTPLHLASEKGHNEIARLLLNHGADANHPDSGGRTPLHLASERGHGEIARSLFDHGADANHPDVGGMTPLHIASLMGRDNIVPLLLDHGASTNHPDSFGGTPLRLALLMSRDNIVRLLLDHEEDTNHADRRG
jgi:ankyrin repeat protein